MRGPLVIVGDTLLDVDLVGHASRLSPDAPVPVLEDLVEHPRPGGAGLAAALAAKDGHDVVLVTALGGDEAGERVERLLDGVEIVRLPYGGTTPVKRRVRAGGQSLLRLDTSGSGRVTARIGSRVGDALRSAGAVLVADYGRGVAQAPGMPDALLALPVHVPLVWDPHPHGSPPVPGVRLATPNRAEAQLFAQRHGVPATRGGEEHSPGGGLTTVRRQADVLVDAWQAHAVVVTLGERGALLSYGAGTPLMIPAPSGPCLDPCGAGDRFAVTAAVSLAQGRVMSEVVQDAVAASTAYVAAGGPASLHRPGGGPPPRSAEDVVERVRRERGVVVATGGCFDLLHAGHVATLRAARGLGDCLVVCLNSDDSVRRLKGPARPLVSAADRAGVLQALEFVDAVLVFDEDTPVAALRRLRPDVWAKGGDYAGSQVPEAAVLEEWGGQAVALPYLQGRSTSELVRTAAATMAATRADDTPSAADIPSREETERNST